MADLIADSQNIVYVTCDDADSQQTNAIAFHLTMEHSSQYCPAQNSALVRALRARRYDQRERAQQCKFVGIGVKIVLKDANDVFKVIRNQLLVVALPGYDMPNAAAMVKISAGRDKTKAKQKIPISPMLAEVLEELDREPKKLTSVHGAGLVFTRDGKPIGKNALRKAFDAAREAAGVKDFHFHDFRHCAVTRWALAGTT